MATQITFFIFQKSNPSNYYLENTLALWADSIWIASLLL